MEQAADEEGTVMSAGIRANSVEVAKIFQARCRVEGCGWAGKLPGSYQDANADRQAHLDEHRDGTR
jgi:hypothetical protein